MTRVGTHSRVTFSSFLLSVMALLLDNEAKKRKRTGMKFKLIFYERRRRRDAAEGASVEIFQLYDSLIYQLSIKDNF